MASLAVQDPRAVHLEPLRAGFDAQTNPSDWPAEFGAVLLATGRMLVRNETEAQDLVQRTYELGIRSLPMLRDPSRTRSWLLTIETREAFRLGRRLRRLIPFDLADGELPPVSAPDVELLALKAALRTLPDRTRTAIVLHHMAGLTVDETALAMGTQANTVKTQLRIGLDRLREALDAG